MAAGRRYTPYRRVVEELGLKQLDVYRYKDHEEIRLLTRTGEVKLVKLPRRRDEMTPEEFREALKKELGL